MLLDNYIVIQATIYEIYVMLCILTLMIRSYAEVKYFCLKRDSQYR